MTPIAPRRSTHVGHDVFGSMARLLKGAAVAKAIGFAAVPILTRLYSPDNFGILSVYTSIVGLLLPLGTLCYTIALPLPRSDRIAFNLLALCMIVTLAMTSFIAIILLLGGPFILSFLSADQLWPYLGLVIVGLFGTCLYESANHWATRKRAYKQVAKSQVRQALLGSIAKIVGGLIGAHPFFLLFGQAIQQSAGTLFITRHFFTDFRLLFRSLSYSRVVSVGQKYLSFPLYRLPSQLLLAASLQVPVLFVASHYGLQFAGYFGLAMTALSLPVSLISKTAGQAYYGEIAAVGRRNPAMIYAISMDITKRLAVLAILPTIALLLLGPILFSLIFGAEWRTAGIFASYLAPFLLALFCCQPVMQVLSVFERNGLFLVLNIVRVVLLAVVLLFASLMDLSANSFVVCYATMSAAFYFLTTLWILLFVRRQAHNQKRF